MSPDTRHKSWDYKILMFICAEGTTASCEAALNMLGGDGWELVSVTEGERYHTAFLKRLR
jgi:hypothetical protein